MQVWVYILLAPVGLVVALLLAMAVLAFWSGYQIEMVLVSLEEELQRSSADLLEMQGRPLASLANDYTYWDEMVSFVESGDLSWAKENIDTCLDTFDVTAVWVFRPDGSIVYSVSETEESASPPLPVASIQSLFAEERLIHLFVWSDAGLAELRGATIHPTHDAERATPPRGYFLAERLWTAPYLSELSRLFRGKVSVEKATEDPTTPKRERGFMHMRQTLSDWQGRPLAVLSIAVPLPMLEQYGRMTKAGIALFVAFSIILIGMLTIFLYRLVSIPLRQLQSYLESGDPELASTLRTKTTEFGSMARLIDQFFDQQRLITIEVEEHRKAEDKLKRLAAAIEQAAESVIITDPDGTFVYVNPAFERMSGYSRADSSGQTPRILKSGQHSASFYRELWDTIRRGEVWTGQLTNRNKDGSLYTAEAVISPVRDADGQIVSFVAVERDITTELRLGEQLNHAQKMEAIGQLAGGVAHDFNNLLQAIGGYTEIARDDLDADHPVQQSLKEVVNATDRARNLISQLLLFSRRQAAQPRVLDLNAVVSGLIGMLERVLGEQVDLEFCPCPDTIKVRADQHQLEQVLMNLSVNARDAMPEGGRLVVETQTLLLDDEYCRAHPWARKGAFSCLSVSDTGIGMAPEVRQHVFEPFFSTKGVGKGTGLGLATVYGIVKQHEGLIHVYSEPGLGTTFRIYLPLVEEEEAQPRAVLSAHAPVRGKGETILLAEDHEMVRALGISILEKHGYRVIAARDGAEAIELFEKYRDEIDLALLDVVMPRKSGKMVYDAIKEVRRELPILFASGYSYQILEIGGVTKDQYAMISKPYRPQELLSRVRALLDGTDPESGAPPVYEGGL